MCLANGFRAMRIAFMTPSTHDPQTPEPTKLDDVFDDHPEFWIGYPLTAESVAHRPTLYLRQRWASAKLFKEMHSLMTSTTSHSQTDIRAFVDDVDRLVAKMERWQHRLPFELHYVWPMCVAVWDLQYVQTVLLAANSLGLLTFL